MITLDGFSKEIIVLERTEENLLILIFSNNLPLSGQSLYTRTEGSIRSCSGSKVNFSFKILLNSGTGTSEAVNEVALFTQ